MKRLLLAAALAASAAVAPAAVASPGVQGCVGEHCADVGVSTCDLAAQGCERPPWPWPPGPDCMWVHHGNLWYTICW